MLKINIVIAKSLEKLTLQLLKKKYRNHLLIILMKLLIMDDLKDNFRLLLKIKFILNILILKK